MVLKIKKLKLVNRQSVRDAMIFLMSSRINKWWVPRHMQAQMWSVGAKISLEDCEDIMEDIFQEAKDHPQNNFERRLQPRLRYRCTAYFQPKKE